MAVECLGFGGLWGQVQGEKRAWEREGQDLNKDSGFEKKTTLRRSYDLVTFSSFFSFPFPFHISMPLHLLQINTARKQCVHSQ